MARKRYKPEEIVSLLRQAEVLHGQGMSMADAIRQLGISEVTFYRWRKEYAGMSGDQLRRLKELEKENERLRRAVSELQRATARRAPERGDLLHPQGSPGSHRILAAPLQRRAPAQQPGIPAAGTGDDRLQIPGGLDRESYGI